MFFLILSFGSVPFVFCQNVVDILLILSVLLTLILNRSKLRVRLFYVFLCFAIFCLSHAMLLDVGLAMYFNLIFRCLIAVLIVVSFNYDYSKLNDTLCWNIRFFAWLALINFILIHLLPYAFFLGKSSDGGYFTRTFGYIFNLSASFALGPFSIMRNAGAFWEPGVLQILMNILVYYDLFEKRDTSNRAWLPILIILTTFSTTGYFILAMQLFVKYRKRIKLNLRGLLLAFFGFGFALLVFVNIKAKVVQDTNVSVEESSALLRAYDFLVTAEIAIDNWSLGVGYSIEEMNNERKSRSISLGSNNEEISLDRGSTNSFVQQFAYFGVILGIMYFILLFKQQLFNKQKTLFFFIYLISLSSEPVIFTSLTWLLFASGLDSMNFKFKRRKILNSKIQIIKTE